MKRVIAAVKTGIENVLKNPVDGGGAIDCRRLFHGRGQCYSQLGYINVDWYYPVIFVTLYQQPEQDDWQQLLEGLGCLKTDVSCLLVQRRYLRGAPIELIWGSLADSSFAYEKGLQFSIVFSAKQNIGFFLDMSPGRQWLRERAEDKCVLNLFSYTCSLSVAAVSGGAKSVVNVDMSRAALNTGRKNHQLNGHNEKLKRDIQFMPYDIFRSWKAITKKGPYDIVVIDPPSRQKGSFIADKDYAKVIRRLETLLPNGGDILLCLNAPELGESFLENLISEHCPAATKISRLENRLDFPEVDNQRNVKMLHYRLS